MRATDDIRVGSWDGSKTWDGKVCLLATYYIQIYFQV